MNSKVVEMRTKYFNARAKEAEAREAYQRMQGESRYVEECLVVALVEDGMYDCLRVDERRLRRIR